MASPCKTSPNRSSLRVNLCVLCAGRAPVVGADLLALLARSGQPLAAALAFNRILPRRFSLPQLRAAPRLAQVPTGLVAAASDLASGPFRAAVRHVRQFVRVRARARARGRECGSWLRL